MGNKMTDMTRKGILTLIKSAITEESLKLPEAFDIEEAFAEIKRHNIISLAYDGAVRCGVPKANPAMQTMFQLYCRNLLISEGQLQAVQAISDAFDAAGVDYMFIKGCNIKKLYPKPELRVMGDADILIRTEQYAKIVPVMERLGYTAKLESNHEYVWTSKQLFLELHKYLIPSYNRDYYAYFGDGWRLAKKTAGCRYALSVEDEFVYIFTHFARHYRDGGIGCSHVTDLWVYKNSYPDMDMEYIENELRKLQLLEFFNNIMQLVAVWFEDAAGNEITDFISDFIFQSGSWRYTILNKAPWLLPVFWPVRWVDAALFRRDNIKKRKLEREFATIERIESYQQALEYVGLEFRFE